MVYFKDWFIFCVIFLVFRLTFGSSGAYQWRLQGPNSWNGAKAAVKKVPVTDLMNLMGYFIFALLGLLLVWLYCYLF